MCVGPNEHGEGGRGGRGVDSARKKNRAASEWAVLDSEADECEASAITAPVLVHGRGREGQHGPARLVNGTSVIPQCPTLDGNQTGPKLWMVMSVTLDMRRLQGPESLRADAGPRHPCSWKMASRKRERKDCSWRGQMNTGEVEASAPYEYRTTLVDWIRADGFLRSALGYR